MVDEIVDYLVPYGPPVPKPGFTGYIVTGGTTAATIALLRSVDADVRAAAFIIELNGLGGRDKLDVPVTVLVDFDA